MVENSGEIHRQLRELRAEAAALRASGDQIVFGEGSPDAWLMIVGEAPGASEAAAGRPFVGRAGLLLDELLREVGLDRREIWITNVAKHRPTRAEGGRLVDRPPRVGEVRADARWLEEELAILRPKIVVGLGNLAARTLVGRDFKMNEQHGEWFPGPLGSRVVATYHPAYALRQTGEDRERVLAAMRQDLAKAKAAMVDAGEGHATRTRPRSDAVPRYPTAT